MSEPEFRAAFAGTGRLEPSVRALAAKHPENVTYLGFVDDKDLAGLYNRSKIFVHYPTWEEPFGLTPLEFSLAVIATVTVLYTVIGGLTSESRESSWPPTSRPSCRPLTAA